MDLTETTKSHEQLLDGVLLNVYRDVAVLPDGSEGVREWIRHPGAAAVVPLFEDGTTLLLRQFRYAPRKLFIEVPAGKLDVPGEDAAQVAQRELGEEAGYHAGRLTPLGFTHPCIGYSNEIIYLFLGQDLTPVPGHTEADEFVEPFRLPFAEAVAMAQRGEIMDAKSEVAILRAAAYLARMGGRDDG